MTRFLLKIMLPLLVVFAALNVAARAVGTLQPPNPVLAGFTAGCEGKPQPCWYGILPGETTAEETDSILIKMGFHFEGQTRSDRDNWILSYTSASHHCSTAIFTGVETKNSDILSVSCEHMFLGDFISLLGEPESLFLRGWSFDQGKLLVEMEFSPANKYKCFDTMPTGKIINFLIGSESLFFHPVKEEVSSWHGYMPYRSYVERYRFPSCEMLMMLP